MSGVRYDRILASTALALILAAPLSAATAQEIPAPAVTAAPAAKADTPETTETTGAIPAATQPASETPAANPTTAVPAAAPEPPAVAATPPAAPDPLASLDPADRAIAEKLRDLLAAKTDRIFASKKERSAVDTFYQNRNLAPLWVGSSRVDLQACKLEYSIVSPK